MPFPKQENPKALLKRFQSILKEASKFYKKPGYLINLDQFAYISNGRLSDKRFRFIGTYASLRNYFYPPPDRKGDDSVTRDMIRRIIEKTNTKSA